MRFRDIAKSLSEGVIELMNRAPLTVTGLNIVAFGSAVAGNSGVAVGIYGTALALGASIASSKNWTPSSKIGQGQTEQTEMPITPNTPKM